MTTRRRGYALAATALTAALSLTGVVATASTAQAEPSTGEFDYFAQAIPGLRTGSVFEAVTYERFESLLKSDGNFALLIGGPADATLQAAATHIDAVAQQYGVERIYVFDPRLDGRTVDVRTSSIDPVRALWSNLTATYLQKDTTPEFDEVDATDHPYLVIYNKAHTEGGAEDRIVASLGGTLDAAALDTEDEVSDYRAEVGALFDTVSTSGEADVEVQSQFDFIAPAMNSRHSATYANATIYGGEILGAEQEAGFVLNSITYPELVALLNSPGQHNILFGGTWCHNTRAVVRDVNDRAHAAGVEKVYLFDLRLDGLSSNVLHIRDSASALSYLYGEIATGELDGIRTQYQTSSSSASHKVTYYPGGDSSQTLLTAPKLQVPYLIEYDRDADAPVTKDWIRDNGDGTFTEFMTEFWWIDDLQGSRNTNRYPLTDVGDAAWVAEQAKQWAFADEALAALDVFFGIDNGDDSGDRGDGDGNGGSGDGDGDGSGDGNGNGNGNGGDDDGDSDDDSSEPTVTVTGEIRPGGQITVTGTGFPASTSVRVELHSDPVVLGSTTTSGVGGFSLPATIPSSITGTSHTVVVYVGGVAYASQAVTMQSALTSTGASAPIVGAAATAFGLLLAAGGALIVTSRRKAVIDG